MDTITIINEILYIISTYEKGKIRCEKPWKRKDRKLFLESLHIMELIVDFLSSPKKQESTAKELFILDFIDKKTNTIFPESETLNNLKSNLHMLNFSRKDIVSEQDKVIELMQIIIKRCKNEKKTKTVFCLLMAFHNLPRVFFKSNPTPLFKCCVPSLASEEALKLAQIWLKNSVTI